MEDTDREDYRPPPFGFTTDIIPDNMAYGRLDDLSDPLWT